MRLILTSTVRRSQRGEPSGFIHTVDLEQNRVTGSCPSPEPDLLIYEHNERGGMRGGKGIAVVGDCIYVANSSVIRAYNTKWELIENISHPSCAGIHDILSLISGTSTKAVSFPRRCVRQESRLVSTRESRFSGFVSGYPS